MDPISIVAIAAFIGYHIFKETPEEKAAREKAAAEREHKRLQDEIEERRREEERLERLRPFTSAEECFRKQYVSYARLSTYCLCPRRFKLVYLDRVIPEDRGFSIYERGTVLHKALEVYLREQIGRKILALDEKKLIAAAFDSRYLQHNKRWWPDHRKEEAKRRRDKFRQNVRFICRTFPSNVEVVAVEHELRFQFDGLNFFGIVDLVLRYPDGRFEIVDYKTGTRRPAKEQLEIYSIPFCRTSSHPNIDFRIICVDRESHYRWTQNTRGTTETTERILRLTRTIMADHSYRP